MKYQNLIIKEFSTFNLEPREGQVQVINQIITEAIDNNKQFILLNAPTGSGKSILGVIAGNILHKLIGSNNVPYSVKYPVPDEELGDQHPEKYSYLQKSVQIITSTKVLQDQYLQFFKEQNKYYVNFKGKTNYSCALKPILGLTAENCYKGTPFYHREIEENEQVKQEYEETCNACEFNYNKLHKNTCDYLITNYARYYIDSLYIRPNFFGQNGVPLSFFKRTVTICDEAHLLNENFVSHYTITFSKSRYTNILNDIQSDFSIKKWTWLKKQLDFIMTGIENKYISKNNYHKSIEILGKVYKDIADYYARLSKWSNGNQAHYFKFKAMADKYFCLGCNIGDFFIYKNDYVLDMNYLTGVLQVKPLFISKIFKDKINISDKVIMMSATLTEEIIKTQLRLEPEDYAFITTENPFNVSDKQVVINTSKLIKLSIKNTYDEETNWLLGKEIRNILKNHIDENGIVLVNSFKHGLMLADTLKSVRSHKVILHNQGTPITDHLTKFIDSSKPSILISPSIFEGIDLHGDRSKFNILAKAPFPSLADKRMMHISRKYQTIYKLMTLEKMIQGMGRSTRFKGDVSTSYLLDLNLVKLLNNKRNIWKNQFQISESLQPTVL